MVVSGRVLDASTLLLEGVRMQAQLPGDVQPGQRLRLRVEQAGKDQLHLKIVSDPATALEHAAHPEGTAQVQNQRDPAATQQIPVQAYALALPGGVEARVYVEADGEGVGGPERGGPKPIVLRYDSPSLGRMDVRLDGQSAAIHVSAGEPAERVHGEAGTLRDALERVRGAAVQVTVHPRGETFNAKA